jgi:hypothetical protein
MDLYWHACRFGVHDFYFDGHIYLLRSRFWNKSKTEQHPITFVLNPLFVSQAENKLSAEVQL